MIFGAVREHIIKRVTRSSRWAKVRKAHLLKNPKCVCCGKNGNQVHHIKPFHIHPELELVPSNLLTMCSNSRCHLDKGHLGYWKSYNINVIEDCLVWNDKYQQRP